MKKIASFDVDMTLLNHEDFKIPASTMKALERLRENYYIVLATGRDMDAKYSEGLAKKLNPDAIIHLNGTKVTVGDELIYEHLMDKELVKRILDYAKGKDFAIGISVGKEDYYVNQQFVTRHDVRRWGHSERNYRSPDRLLDMDVRTMCYLGDEAGAKAMEKEFPQLKLPMFSSKEGADVVEVEASKAEGLKRLCEYFGVDMKDTVAFGDSMNDYEIIKEAGIGVAMGNGLDALKAVADYVTTPIGEDGVWNACVALGLIEEGND